MSDPFRRFDDLTDLIIRHKARRSRRSLFSEEKAAQMFVGRAGQSKLANLVFGSVAASMAQIAPVPCTIVP